ncbi:hypothetical protein CC80DRAFT_583486 [Byssothecium circinans]|uniref:F-box domain-containing protein n=1 Tax=Byssothecium circinans TaxID=147558 RepID=A0A6A5T9F2_9PLEO|nr:hypothetical protein CC80DRAFT_583486 [Byssothecium circinans]
MTYTSTASLLKRRQNSIRISVIGFKSTIERVRSKVNLPSSKKSSPKAFRFFELPRNIRNQIYSALFRLLIPARLVVREPNGWASFEDETFPRFTLPKFCYLNAQMYRESIPLLLENSEVVLEDISAIKILSDYLHRGSNLAFGRGITSLTFESTITWRPHATHTAQRLIEKCKSLRQIKIEIPASSCVEWVDGQLCVRQKKHIIDNLDFCCLLDCLSLEKVTLSCWGGLLEAKKLGIALDAVFEPIIMWVQHNICRGSGIALVVEHVRAIPTKRWGMFYLPVLCNPRHFSNAPPHFQFFIKVNHSRAAAETVSRHLQNGPILDRAKYFVPPWSIAIAPTAAWQMQTSPQTTMVTTSSSLPPSTSPQNVFTKLMGLPRELRDMVWKEKLKTLNLPRKVRICCHYKKGSKAKRETAVIPAFCYVNKQVFSEAVPLFFKDRNIALCGAFDVEALADFLEAHKTVRSSIRSVTFESYIAWHLCKHIPRLLQYILLLEHVQLEVETMFVTKNQGRQLEKDITAIKYNDFRLVAQVPHLKTLTLRCFNKTPQGMTGTFSMEEISKPVMKWAHDAFDKRPEVKLSIKFIESYDIAQNPGAVDDEGNLKWGWHYSS